MDTKTSHINMAFLVHEAIVKASFMIVLLCYPISTIILSKTYILSRKDEDMHKGINSQQEVYLLTAYLRTCKYSVIKAIPN